MTHNDNPYWSETVTADEKYHTPADTFTKKAPEIVKILMDGAHGDATIALRRLVFYMNRGGNKLTNNEELTKAKIQLEHLEQTK